MKAILLLSLLVLSLTLQAQYSAENLRIEPGASLTKYAYQNLQLFPIRANQVFTDYHNDIDNYVTLKEALEKKTIRITEAGLHGSGEVNTLHIENVGNQPIMILAGEVVQGGKQDRMIGQDLILQPGIGKKDISVFCVEHGRWQSRGDGMSFNSYAHASSNELRKAARVEKSQQQVWNRVSETTAKNEAQTKTGTLTALQDSKPFGAELKKYTDHFRRVFAAQPDVIGVIAVSGDRILGCDMFATHEIFGQHYDHLVNGYATEAITSGSDVAVSYEKVKGYLISIISNEREQERLAEEKGALLIDRGKKVHIATF